MANSKPTNVAIIGAGMAGLSLALALHQQSIPCTIYERRGPSSNEGGGIMISPNALRILDDLGVYKRIRARGFNFETLTFKDEEGATTGKYYFGHEKLYGYKALRVYRQYLLDELLTMNREQNTPMHFGKKFSKILSETEEGVTFEFADGTTATSDLLIGADGIHSTIRNYLSSARPLYTGFLAMTNAIPSSKIRFPKNSDFPLPISISAKPGAFVMAPQSLNGEEIFIGTQRAFPERDRAGWDALLADKKQLAELIRMDYADWPDVVRSALENIIQEKLTIWAMYTLPRLEAWVSPNRKVILVGDAAHALPPTAGQGVNQAFEDIYSLALILGNVTPDVKLADAFVYWQTWRQERIDKLLELTRQMNNKRLPAAEQANLKKGEVWQDESETEGPGEQMRWLYGPDLKKEVLEWIEKQGAK